MIIYHQRNIAAFAGNHIVYWIGQPLRIRQHRISVTSAAVPPSGPVAGSLGLMGVGI